MGVPIRAFLLPVWFTVQYTVLLLCSHEMRNGPPGRGKKMRLSENTGADLEGCLVLAMPTPHFPLFSDLLRAFRTMERHPYIRLRSKKDDKEERREPHLV